jgi:endonuclease-8
MPEGNEIHRWAERHEAAFGGKTVRVDGPQGRFTDSDLIDGRKLQRVRAVGKHLGYDFGRDRILHIHMGMRGDFTEGSGALPEVRGALRLRMWNAAAVKATAAAGESLIGDGSGKAKKAGPGETMRRVRYADDDGTGQLTPEQMAWVELRGPTDCSIYSEAKWKQLLERLGPDPLNASEKGDGLERALLRIGKSKKPIAALLMDQAVIAGLGNIFRAELLYRARLNPFVAGKEVPEATLRAIWKDAGALMRAGMIDRRIVTTRAEDRPSHTDRAASEDRRSHSGKAAKVVAAPVVTKEELHYVYRRNGKPCFVCGTKVMLREMEGRNLFWCPGCQAEQE